MRIGKLLFSVFMATMLYISTAYAQQSENRLRWASAPSITNPDPYYNTDREAMLINGQLVWDTLIYRNPKTGEYEPLLATSWKWTDDVTLEFVLRDGVKFHDGRPLTVKDVVYTFNYISNPDNKINVQSNVNWIKGAEAVDEKTVKLTLKSAFPPALEYISSLHAILPDGFYGDDRKAGHGGLVGTGPYKFEEFVPGSTMKLAAWDGYFDGSPKGKPSFAGIEYRSIPDASTQIAELLSGGVDWIWHLPKDQAEPVASLPDIVVNPAETMRITFLSFNVRDKEGGNPLQDLKVRQAIAYAIDRQTIVDQVMGQGSSLISTPCFRTQFGCVQDVAQHPYDPEKAKLLLKEAGYEKGLKLDLIANAIRDRSWVEAVAGYLNAVGIETNVQLLQYANIAERNVGNKTDLWMGDWGSYGINDVSALFNNFFMLTPDDMARDEVVANALKTASATIDSKVRLENYDTAVKRIAENVYWLPLWTNPVTYAHGANLNFEAFPDENPRFFLTSWKN